MSEVIKLINQRIFRTSSIYGVNVSYKLISIGIMWLFTISALIGISLGYADWFIPKTPLNLLIGLVLLFINVPLVRNRGTLLFIIAFLVGMLVEITGVTTGQLFGVYEYGSNLGLKIMGVPIMIGVYWAVLVIVTSHMARSVVKSMFKVSLLGATLMVGLDFIMEQMASSFDFWHFENGLASLQNYITWFIVSFSLQLVAYSWLPKYKGNFCIHLYFNQVVFFAVSYFLYSLM